MHRIFVAAILFVMLVGCATTRLATPSGGPEAMFYHMTLDEVKGRIADGCSRSGIHVLDMGASHVLVGKQLDGGDAMLAQLLIGNSYSTTPWRKVHFAIFPAGKGFKVTARQWTETQMVGGQMRTVEMTAEKHLKEMQQFLWSIGGV